MAEYSLEHHEQQLFGFGKFPSLERVGVRCVEYFRHMASNDCGAADDARFRAMAVQNIGLDLLDESMHA